MTDGYTFARHTMKFPVKLPHSEGAFVFRTGAYSDRGPRERNEDMVHAGYTVLPDGRTFSVLVVADGVGGEAGGDAASRSVAGAIRESLAVNLGEGAREGCPVSIEHCLVEACYTAHAFVQSLAVDEPAYERASTTLSVVVTDGDQAYIASLGDSRVYLMRGARVTLLTRDDSLVQDLVEQGVVAAENAEDHPMAHVITRCVAADREAETPTIHRLPLHAGDKLLACSDGFWKVGRSLLEALARQRGSHEPRFLARELVSRALSMGADDNTSVAILDVRDRVVCADARTTLRYLT